MGNQALERDGFICPHSTYLNGFIWRFTNFIRCHRRLYLFAKGLLSIKRYGLKKTIREIATGLRGHLSSMETELSLSKSARAIQENMVFPKKIKISIIAALNNTREQYLKEMMESVMAQTYGEWELCLADESDKGHMYVKHICREYAQKDSRIKYRKFDRNLGISETANKAIGMSSGEYIGLLDQNDLLHPSALFEAMKAITGEGADFIYSDEAAFSGHLVTMKQHKPDFAADTLCSYNYIGHFIVFDRELTGKAGTFRSEFEGSHDYDLILRYTDAATGVFHIPKLLYFRRNDEKPYDSGIDKKMEAISASEECIREYLRKHGRSGRVERKIGLPGFFRVIYELTEKPLVSIIIPNKDNAPLLRDCISSILEKTNYENYEIIIVENNSSEEATFAFYGELKRYANIHIVRWQGKGFNFSEICNFGAKCAHGEQLVFLNNDVLIITPNWIEEMLMYSQRSDVGAVGAKLYFLNGSVQHAGMVLGLGGTVGHIYHGAPHNASGFMGKLQIVQNMSVVTAACMMTRKRVFEEVGPFLPDYCVSFNDVDLCIRIRKAGYLIVWTPYAEAYHLESKSRGYNTTAASHNNLAKETALFRTKWEKEITAGDPYYNCNFSLERTDYSLK